MAVGEVVVASVGRVQRIGFLVASGLVFALPLAAMAQNARQQSTAAQAASDQETFATPEAAVQAVTTALANDDTAKLLDIFGHEYEAVVLGPDPASGRVMRQRAADALRQKISLHHDRPDKLVLVAANGWPMPIPLVRHGERWVFDTAAGEQEILARRIGEDELDAIATLHAFVEAEYSYAKGHTQAGEPEYAQYVQSTPGQTDGLWWDTATAAKAGPSPLTSFASANQAFLEGREPGDPFRGYFFRVLTAQGPHAPGGAKEYLEPDGRMTGGFAMIAWPAAWREGGVMTFLVGPDGKVLQQDLGPETQSVIDGIRAYDPGPGWFPAESRPVPAHK